MTQTFNTDIQIQGSADVTQLKVVGVTSQSLPLQEWQDNTFQPLARVTNSGQLRIGTNLSGGAADALMQATYNPASGFPTSVWHASGVIGSATAVGGPINWVFHDLQLAGTAGVTGLHNALYSKLTQSNTGTANSAEVRAATFQAISQGGSALPVGQATGVRAIVGNAGSATVLSSASGVEALITNDPGGSISSAAAFSVIPPQNSGTIGTIYGLKIPDLTQGSANYAIYSGSATAHFGDNLEIPVFSAPPVANPPANFIKLYTKLNAGSPQLYAKDATGTEYSVGGNASFGNQAANQVFAGPASGGATAPAFRGLVAADLAAALASPPPIGGTTPNSAILSALTLSASSYPSIYVTGPSGTPRQFVLQTSGSNRWVILADSTAESGSNSGSDFTIGRFNDSGVYQGGAFAISRATGVMTITNANIPAGTINGTTIGATTPSTGAFTTLNASTSLTTATVNTTDANLTGRLNLNGPQTGPLLNAYFTVINHNVDGLTGINFLSRYTPQIAMGTMYGLYMGQQLYNSANNVTSAISLLATMNTDSTYTGTVSNAYLLYARNPTRSGSQAIGNVTGLYIEGITTGTNNFAIQTNAGLISLGDQVKITGSADRTQLIVKANATQNTNLQEWQNSSGAVLAFLNGSGLVLNNNFPLYAKDSGGTARPLAFIDTSNNAIFGYPSGVAGFYGYSGNTQPWVTSDTGNNIILGRGAGLTNLTVTDTITNAQSYALRLSHYLSSGTPAVGIGVGMDFLSPTSDGTQREFGLFRGYLSNVGASTWASGFQFIMFDHVGPTYPIVIGTDGAGNPTLALYTGAPVARQTVTGSRSGGAALANLLTALANLGAIVNSTTA